MQKAAALALHAALEENQDSTAAVLDILVKTYNEKLQVCLFLYGITVYVVSVM